MQDLAFQSPLELLQCNQCRYFWLRRSYSNLSGAQKRILLVERWRSYCDLSSAQKGMLLVERRRSYSWMMKSVGSGYRSCKIVVAWSDNSSTLGSPSPLYIEM